MKRSDQNVFSKRLNVDVTDRSKRKPAIGSKPMHKPLELDLVVELLLNHDKRLGIDQLQFDFGLVFDLEPKGRFVPANACDGMGNKDLLGRQRVMSSSTDFGKHQIIMGKRNHIRSAGTNVE